MLFLDVLTSIFKYEVLHGETAKETGRYLLATKDIGIKLKFQQNALHCSVDALFDWEWSRGYPGSHPTTFKSRTGYIMTYECCHVIWASK
jgi:hypothetical protein